MSRGRSHSERELRPEGERAVGWYPEAHFPCLCALEGS